MPMFNDPRYGQQPPVVPPIPRYTPPATPAAPVPPPAPTPNMSSYMSGPQDRLGVGGQPPSLPSPNVGPAPSANATGGPSVQQPIRENVYSQLYKTGKQMQGKDNMFASFGAPAEAAADPFAMMQPPAPAETTGPPPLPSLPPAPTGPSPSEYPIHLQQPQAAPPRPIDRFPRLAGYMPGSHTVQSRKRNRGM